MPGFHAGIKLSVPISSLLISETSFKQALSKMDRWLRLKCHLHPAYLRGGRGKEKKKMKLTNQGQENSQLRLLIIGEEPTHQLEVRKRYRVQACSASHGGTRCQDKEQSFLPVSSKPFVRQRGIQEWQIICTYSYFKLLPKAVSVSLLPAIGKTCLLNSGLLLF